MRNRVGRFEISRHLFDREPERIAELLAYLKVLPYRAECLYCMDVIQFEAMSPFFDEVSPSREPPFYQIEVTTDPKTGEFVSAKAIRCDGK